MLSQYSFVFISTWIQFFLSENKKCRYNKVIYILIE